MDKQHEIQWTTVGNPTHSTGDMTYFDQARKGTEVYKKGEFIYVRGSSTAPWIAQIENFCLSKENQLNVRCCWFLRQEDIFDESMLHEKDPQEVFMGVTIDDNIVQTIMGKTQVLFKPDYDAIVKEPSQIDKDLYYCQNKCLDPVEKVFVPLDPEHYSLGTVNNTTEKANGNIRKRKDTPVSENDAHDNKKIKKNLIAHVKKSIDSWIKELSDLNKERAEQLKEDIDFRFSKLK